MKGTGFSPYVNRAKFTLALPPEGKFHANCSLPGSILLDLPGFGEPRRGCRVLMRSFVVGVNQTASYILSHPSPDLIVTLLLFAVPAILPRVSRYRREPQAQSWLHRPCGSLRNVGRAGRCDPFGLMGAAEGECVAVSSCLAVERSLRISGVDNVNFDVNFRTHALHNRAPRFPLLARLL